MRGRKTDISLVINTKNEEKNIRDCINSAKEIADEIIVADMHSVDKTKKIASECGAKVFDVKDYGYVEPARNFALSKASKKWTLLLDADERLTPKLQTYILQVTSEDKYDGFKFPFKNIFFGKWIRHSMWWPDYHLRLFKTGSLKWHDKIHGGQDFSGSLFEAEAVEKYAFVHNNIETLDEMVEMVDRYSGIEKVFASKKDPSARDLIEFLDHEFQWRFLEHKGYKDGIHGFVLAKFMNFYRFLEFAKWWERNEYKQMFSPSQLKEAAEAAYSNSAETERLKAELEKIQSSKFYKTWQKYTNTRDKILRRSS